MANRSVNLIVNKEGYLINLLTPFSVRTTPLFLSAVVLMTECEQGSRLIIDPTKFTSSSSWYRSVDELEELKVEVGRIE